MTLFPQAGPGGQWSVVPPSQPPLLRATTAAAHVPARPATNPLHRPGKAPLPGVKLTPVSGPWAARAGTAFPARRRRATPGGGAGESARGGRRAGLGLIRAAGRRYDGPNQDDCHATSTDLLNLLVTAAPARDAPR
jgi:hypothetical protein